MSRLPPRLSLSVDASLILTSTWKQERGRERVQGMA